MKIQKILTSDSTLALGGVSTGSMLLNVEGWHHFKMVSVGISPKYSRKICSPRYTARRMGVLLEEIQEESAVYTVKRIRLHAVERCRDFSVGKYNSEWIRPVFSQIYFVASIPKSISPQSNYRIISLGKKINDFPSDIHMSIYVLAYITQTSWRDPPTNHSKKDTWYLCLQLYYFFWRQPGQLTNFCLEFSRIEKNQIIFTLTSAEIWKCYCTDCEDDTTNFWEANPISEIW